MTLESRIGNDSIDRLSENMLFGPLQMKPFYTTFAMVQTVNDIINDSKLGPDSAYRIFNWMVKNFSQEFENPRNEADGRELWELGYRYKTADKAFKEGKGMCWDAAILYATMAKIAGLDAGVALVSRLREADHACAWVRHEGNLRLVDVTYGSPWGFGITHLNNEPLNDQQAKDFFENNSERINAGEFRDTERRDDRTCDGRTDTRYRIQFTDGGVSWRVLALVGLITAITAVGSVNFEYIRKFYERNIPNVIDIIDRGLRYFEEPEHKTTETNSGIADAVGSTESIELENGDRIDPTFGYTLVNVRAKYNPEDIGKPIDVRKPKKKF